MALSKEEIAIRLGIDARGVQSGMSRVDKLIENNLAGVQKKFKKFSGDILGGAVMGFIGSLTSTVTGLISEGVDKLTDYMSKQLFDMIYDVNDRLTELVDRINDASKKAGRKHETTKEEMDRLDKEQEREQFESMSPEARAKIANERVKETARLRAEKEAEIARLRKQSAEARALNTQNPQGATLEFVEKIAEAEAEVLRLRKENIRATKDQHKAIKDMRVEVKPQKIEPNKPQPVTVPVRPTGMAAVDDYMQKIKAAQDAYKAKTDYSKFGKAVAEEQAKIASEVVQKVSIVEVKE